MESDVYRDYVQVLFKEIWRAFMVFISSLRIEKVYPLHPSGSMKLLNITMLLL